MRLAVIASMKSGLEQFIYREIDEFAAEGIAICLFPDEAPTRAGPPGVLSGIANAGLVGRC